MKSPIKWVGGKSREIKYIEKHIPQYFDEYCEPFLGGGALYWYLNPRIAYLGDTNEELINFYKVIKDNPKELEKEIQKHKNEKEYFKSIVLKLNNKLYSDEIERASIFYYLNKTSFSGKWRVNSKGLYNNTFANYERGEDYCRKIDKIEEYSKMLNENAILGCCDFKTLLDMFKNCENGFVFLDPPYLECDSMYTTTNDYKQIYLDIYNYMKISKCKILLVCKSTDYLEELFKDYIKDEYGWKYVHNAKSNKKHKHLIIKNY